MKADNQFYKEFANLVKKAGINPPSSDSELLPKEHTTINIAHAAAARCIGS
jgi:hypothetical protein